MIFSCFYLLWVYRLFVPCCPWKTATVRWDTSMGLTAGNGSNRWDWEANDNKTWMRLEAGMEMRMNSWERKGVGLKRSHRSSLPYVLCRPYNVVYKRPKTVTSYFGCLNELWRVPWNDCCYCCCCCCCCCWMDTDRATSLTSSFAHYQHCHQSSRLANTEHFDMTITL